MGEANWGFSLVTPPCFDQPIQVMELQAQVEHLRANQQHAASDESAAEAQQAMHEARAAHHESDVLREKLEKERGKSKLLKQRCLHSHRLLGEHVIALKEQVQAAVAGQQAASRCAGW